MIHLYYLDYIKTTKANDSADKIIININTFILFAYSSVVFSICDFIITFSTYLYSTSFEEISYSFILSLSKFKRSVLYTGFSPKTFS